MRPSKQRTRTNTTQLHRSSSRTRTPQVCGNVSHAVRQPHKTSLHSCLQPSLARQNVPFTPFTPPFCTPRNLFHTLHPTFLHTQNSNSNPSPQPFAHPEFHFTPCTPPLCTPRIPFRTLHPTLLHTQSSNSHRHAQVDHAFELMDVDVNGEVTQYEFADVFANSSFTQVLQQSKV